jgi:hypothetical protein
MEKAEDREYEAAQSGYGAAEPEADEDTPPQDQQQPEHEQPDVDGVSENANGDEPRGRD